jgi:hypothetical protein
VRYFVFTVLHAVQPASSVQAVQRDPKSEQAVELQQKGKKQMKLTFAHIRSACKNVTANRTTSGSATSGVASSASRTKHCTAS